MEKLENVIFYAVDKAIRTYRQYAQHQLRSKGFNMTVDQWIIIKCILENPAITQLEIAERSFKDNASVTRIINLLVKAKMLHRKVNQSDRRRAELQVTALGRETIQCVDEIVQRNREVALAGISRDEIEITRRVMEQITRNSSERSGE